MKKFWPQRLTLASTIAGVSILGALIIGVPLLFGIIFFNTDKSWNTTKYVFLGSAAFFLLFLGLFIPFTRWVMKMLRIHGTNPFDLLSTLIIIFVSSSFLAIIVVFTIPLLRWAKNNNTKYHIFHSAISATLFFLAARMRYYGRRKDGCIFFANHSSGIIDYASATQAMGTEPFNIVAGINLRTNNKGLGNKLISLSIGKIVEEHSISLDRSREASRQHTLRRIIEERQKGKNIVFFPEGTRNTIKKIQKDGVVLREFFDSVFKLAWKEGICMQPLVFMWPAIWRGKDDHRIGIRPCRIDAHFLDPIDPRGYIDYTSFKDACWTAMDAKLRESKKVQDFLTELQK